MKIQIQEAGDCQETEVVIRCRQADEQILKMLTLLRAFDRKITGVREGRTYLLDAAQILYIDTVDKKTFFYTADGVYETPLRLYELEERLGAADFLRASKSMIVNFSQVRSLRPDFGGRMRLCMSSGEEVFVSRQYVPGVREKLGL